MEFWGVEVKAGAPLKVVPEHAKIIHISQAALGEVKNGKGPKRCYLRLKIEDKMYVIGTLSAKERPQIMFDLVMPKEFELSHDWKDGSIYIAGYSAYDETSAGGFSDEDDSEEEAEDMQVDIPLNGKIEPEKPKKKEVTIKLLNKKPPSAEDDDEDDSDFSEEGGDFKVDGGDEDDDDSDDDDSSDEDESDNKDESDDEVPELLPQENKPSKSTLPAAKKAKLATFDKSGGKAPATNGKLREQNPKSGDQKSSKSNKPLNASSAHHSKAKHAGK